VTQPVYDEPFRIVLPKHHAWAKNESISAEQLQEEPLLLLGAGNCFRDQVLEACPRCAHGTGLQKTMEGSSLETIRHMVATGLGVTVLPSSAADPQLGSQSLVSIRKFSAPEPSRRVAIAWRVTYPRTRVIDLLRAVVLDSKLPGVTPVRP
jgi:LysR family hydrogen peroxide-inducible transcriptional activator